MFKILFVMFLAMLDPSFCISICLFVCSKMHLFFGIFKALDFDTGNGSVIAFRQAQVGNQFEEYV